MGQRSRKRQERKAAKAAALGGYWATEFEYLPLEGYRVPRREGVREFAQMLLGEGKLSEAQLFMLEHSSLPVRAPFLRRPSYCAGLEASQIIIDEAAFVDLSREQFVNAVSSVALRMRHNQFIYGNAYLGVNVVDNLADTPLDIPPPPKPLEYAPALGGSLDTLVDKRTGLEPSINGKDARLFHADELEDLY